MTAHKFKKLDVIVALLIAGLFVFSWGAKVGFSWSGTTNTLGDGFAEVEDLNVTGDFYWNSENRTDTVAYPEQAASYIIFTDGTTITAKNGTTGQIDFSGTNESSVIQNTIDVTPDFGMIVIKGQYAPDSIINLKSNLVLDLRQANFSWTQTGNLFQLRGSLGSTSNLASNATVGDISVTVLDASICSVDDYILVRSNNGGTYADAEIHQVKAVNTTTDVITFYDSLYLPYTTANIGRVTKINHKENVEIIGGNIIGSNTELVTRAISFLYSVNCVVDGVSIKKSGYGGVELISCKHIQVKNCEFEEILGRPLTSPNDGGYAIETANACSEIEIQYNTFRNVRRALMLGAYIASSYPGQTISVKFSHNTIDGVTSVGVGGGAYGNINAEKIYVESNTFDVPTKSAVNTGSLDIFIKNNVIYQADAAFSASAGAIKIILENNYLYLVNYGVNIAITGVQYLKVDGLYVLGNVIGGTIFFDGKTNNVAQIEINNVINRIQNDDYYGIFIYNHPKYVTITNCKISLQVRTALRIDGALGGLISQCDLSDSSTGAGSHSAIELLDCVNITVTDNRLYDDQGVPTQQYGISEEGTSDYNVFANNWFEDNTGGAINKIGANTKTRDNEGYIELGDIQVSGTDLQMYNGTDWITIGTW